MDRQELWDKLFTVKTLLGEVSMGLGSLAPESEPLVDLAASARQAVDACLSQFNEVLGAPSKLDAVLKEAVESIEKRLDFADKADLPTLRQIMEKHGYDESQFFEVTEKLNKELHRAATLKTKVRVGMTVGTW